jgi:Flp pilus assembly protein TadB
MVSLEEVKTDATNFIKDNVGAIAAGVGGLAVGGTVGYLAGAASSSKKRRTRKKSKSVSKRKRNYSSKRYKKSKGKRKRYTPHTAGKRKDRSHRRIRQTSTGQPYIILANGRARFISKKSARLARKRKGGRY